MSDKILLSNLMFYGFHGVFEYEREQGQRFYLDIELMTDLSLAGKTDNLNDTVDYTKVYGCVKEIVENYRFQLLEALAHKIADTILVRNSVIHEVKIRIRKPAVPIPGQIDFVQIEIVRGR
ncbi:dihydroneopterin aldolase [Dendrosporobacter sp. 1207_IL3150]|uniref:dihydroneopterin aldolase n=1 Tax=Dendrosporobacter sp. 1207_IL3150 TaxID=3084054 RepID=UPI002FDAC2AC